MQRKRILHEFGVFVLCFVSLRFVFFNLILFWFVLFCFVLFCFVFDFWKGMDGQCQQTTLTCQAVCHAAQPEGQIVGGELEKTRGNFS